MLKRIAIIFQIAWSAIKVFFQLLYGAWKISALKQPIVTVFGGSRFKPDHPYVKKAQQLAQKLLEADISILNGGGPGIMEAASCAMDLSKIKNAKSIGIGVTGLKEMHNPCVHEYFELNYFFARKWLLTRYSKAFIVFPGGFGTLDELAEVITLIQTKQSPRVPIVLFGVEYWDDFMVWVKKEALEHGLIAKEDLALFTLTDDLEQVFCLVRDECKIPHSEE
jgi:hypothetical protein